MLTLQLSIHPLCSTLLILENPRRASDGRQVLLRSGAAGHLFVPVVHDAVPFTVGSAIEYICFRIHDAQDRTPLAARGVTASDPLVRILGVVHGRALLAARQRRLAGFIQFVRLETADPYAHVLSGASIGRRFGGGWRFVGFFGSRAPSAIGVVLVHLSISCQTSCEQSKE
jgi:hypothetical protein